MSDLGRTRYRPTFLQMLDNLSDSPARRARDAATAISDSLSAPGHGAASSAPVLVDATMDGCNPPVVKHHLTRCEFILILFYFCANLHDTPVYPSGPNTSSVRPPLPADLVEPMAPPGMVAEYQVTPVGPIVGIFVHW